MMKPDEMLKTMAMYNNFKTQKERIFAEQKELLLQHKILQIGLSPAQIEKYFELLEEAIEHALELRAGQTNKGAFHLATRDSLTLNRMLESYNPEVQGKLIDLRNKYIPSVVRFKEVEARMADHQKEAAFTQANSAASMLPEASSEKLAEAHSSAITTPGGKVGFELFKPHHSDTSMPTADEASQRESSPKKGL